jgi:hypothetical protein
MTDDDFVGYVGDPDFHDGSILRVIADVDVVRVAVRGSSGQEFAVEFRGVEAVRANRPEGMMIYSLSEMRTRTAARLFVFTNWEVDDEASLEVEAEDFSVTKLK